MDDILQPQYSLKRLSPRSPSTITMAGDIHDNRDVIARVSIFMQMEQEDIAELIAK